VRERERVYGRVVCGRCKGRWRARMGAVHRGRLGVGMELKGTSRGGGVFWRR
jgi:hypothetical protein